jgi:hypothetical protein
MRDSDEFEPRIVRLIDYAYSLVVAQAVRRQDDLELRGGGEGPEPRHPSDISSYRAHHRATAHGDTDGGILPDVPPSEESKCPRSPCTCPTISRPT